MPLSELEYRQLLVALKNLRCNPADASLVRTYDVEKLIETYTEKFYEKHGGKTNG